MKYYHLKISTSRHLDENGYKKYKEIMNDMWGENEIKWEELEEMGIFVIRTEKPDEEVLTIYELSTTELGEPIDENN